MKRGLAALLLAATAIAAGMTEYIWMSSSASVFLDMLNEADAHMELNEMVEARELTERMDNRFSREAGVYDIFLFHSEVLDISANMAALRRYAQVGETAEFMATSARIKRALLSIVNSRTPRVENVL